MNVTASYLRCLRMTGRRGGSGARLNSGCCRVSDTESNNLHNNNNNNNNNIDEPAEPAATYSPGGKQIL